MLHFSSLCCPCDFSHWGDIFWPWCSPSPLLSSSFRLPSSCPGHLSCSPLLWIFRIKSMQALSAHTTHRTWTSLFIPKEMGIKTSVLRIQGPWTCKMWSIVFLGPSSQTGETCPPACIPETRLLFSSNNLNWGISCTSRPMTIANHSHNCPQKWRRLDSS